MGHRRPARAKRRVSGRRRFGTAVAVAARRIPFHFKAYVAADAKKDLL